MPSAFQDGRVPDAPAVFCHSLGIDGQVITRYPERFERATLPARPVVSNVSNPSDGLLPRREIPSSIATLRESLDLEKLSLARRHLSRRHGR